MSPLGGLTGGEAVSAAATRRDFSTGGAGAAMTRLWGALARAAPPDAFTNFRVAVLLDLASDFDAGGGGTADEFDALVREHEFDDRSASGAVRVMTIHKSKGLGFDLVMLPGLSAAGFGPKGRGETLLQGGDSAHPDWVLHKPNKNVCELDPVLSAAQERIAADEIFEEVCLFYVALTRARRGLYLFTASGDKPDASKQGGYVLAKLGREETGIMRPGAGRVVRLLGDREWFGGSPVRARAAEPAGPEPGIPAAFIAAKEDELEGVSPSATRDFEQAGDRVFDPDSSRVLDFGTHMHALFEKVEWLEDADPEALLAEWRREARPDGEMDRHITPQFLACFAHPDFRRELARPQAASTLWREKRFEIVVGGKWISGTFDRVVLRHGEGGAVESAVLLDYKTNRVGDAAAVARAAAHYSGQMGAYRQALATMLGIDPGRIRAALLFTVPGVAVGVAD
ncbi:MAG: 3'-5' exonuclease [Kiritimatiellia bacterium]